MREKAMLTQEVGQWQCMSVSCKKPWDFTGNPHLWSKYSGRSEHIHFLNIAEKGTSEELHDVI